MRTGLFVLAFSVASALTATGAVAQLQMQEQSVGAPRRSPPVYKPQSVEEPPAAAAPTTSTPPQPPAEPTPATKTTR